MSKKREYRNYPSTDAPQQKPGTTRQAQAENCRIEAEVLGHQAKRTEKARRQNPPGQKGPVLVGQVELP